MSTEILTKDEIDTIPFDGLTARSIAARANGAIQTARRLVAAIKTVPAAKRSSETVLEPLNRVLMVLQNAEGLCELVASVHVAERVRTAAEAGAERLSAQGTAFGLDPKLYRAVSGVDPATLDPDYRRFHEHAMRDFCRNGIDRSVAVRKRIQALNEKITKVGQEFDRNCRKATGSIFVTPEQLAGLPGSYVAAHPPNDDGLVEIKAHAYPDLIPFMTFAESQEDRKKLWFVRNTLAPENAAVLQRLRDLRHELAMLLGYKNYADYVTETKMMKSAANAEAFIEGLDVATRERATSDRAQLLAFKQTFEPDATEILPWERAYLVEMLTRTQYAFDSTSVMPYFRYDSVKVGIFRTIERAFDVRIEEDPEASVWHESVSAYLLYDGDGSLRGRFFLDMHPRDGKYAHAACFPIHCGVLNVQLSQAALVCNFTPEASGIPALLQYDEAVTFLHEFGHLVHMLLSGRHRISTQSGFNVEWDFVEAPSNMLENFFQSTKTLQMFAIHHETGEPIPAGLVRSMLSADAFARGAAARRQAGLSWLSLNAYTRVDVPMTVLEREMQEQFMGVVPQEGTHWFTMFGHLNGYSAIYYTYENSKTIATDFWSQFDPNNPFDGDAAMRYRREILEPGGTKDAADLCESFLGRPFSHDAYRKWLEITPENLLAK